MPELKREEWHKLTQNHRWALEILAEASDAHIQPECPRSMKAAMHDLWRFKFAERSFELGMLTYKITFLGRRAYQEISEATA
ncbi:MAG: hypothetical protein AAFY24_01950 [Pseudomonadota bacterium]